MPRRRRRSIRKIRRKRLSKPKPERDCRDTALGLLSRREHSRLELTRKLAKRGFDRTEIDALLDELIAGNLLSEERFAEAYVHARRERGFGPVAIEMELRERGVADEIVAEYLVFSDSCWLDVARAQQHKKFAGRMPDDFKEFSRQARFLQSRGFSAELIRRILGDID